MKKIQKEFSQVSRNKNPDPMFPTSVERSGIRRKKIQFQGISLDQALPLSSNAITQRMTTVKLYIHMYVWFFFKIWIINVMFC